ncbi:MAG TPA: tetratricopeptide repeat protein [Verrucomicrobiae bacterium]|nr:tetratricopeptide repeat protein [Verrucomicrobiae bacterium]
MSKSRSRKEKKKAASVRPANRNFALLTWLALALIAALALVWSRIPPGHWSNNPVARPSDSFNLVSVPPASLPANIGALSSDAENGARQANQGELIEQGRYAEAIQQYQAALKTNADDEDLHYNLGIAYARLGRTNEAIQEYETALKLFPDYVAVHINLGNLLLSLGRADEAIAHLRAALESTPDNALAHNNLGSALAHERKYDEAMLQFTEALRLDTNYLEARFNLASAHLALKKYDESIGEFEALLREKPYFDPASRLLSVARQRKALQKDGSSGSN